MDRNKENYKKIFNLGTSELFDTHAKTALYQSIRRQHRRRRYRRVWGYATGIAAALMLFFMYFPYNPAKELIQQDDIIQTAQHNQRAIQAGSDLLLASSVRGQDRAKVNPLKVDGDEDILKLDEHVGDNEVEYATVYVPYGKRQAFVLPDQSTAWLNAGSYLTFKKDMSQGTREVYLNGEGYFDVTHTGRPFVVRTAETQIHVLGTTFNVNSYEEDNHTVIELLTGAVSLESTKGLFEGIRMKPGERISFDSKNKKISINRNAKGDDVLWTKRQLVLQQLSIDELARRLERIYNVRIHLDSRLRASSVAYSGRLNIDVDIVTSLRSLYELNDYEITQIEKEVWIRKR
ncbi:MULTISPECIES: FecR family protein [Sphingobacterium]|uniref:FecR family protein n=1 Tax=Sphingobacterium TaxID=28453 RepID=UPI0013DCD970|nr:MULTISPECIES: FecR domain-containing protein [unclassified Sphingobacterium]